MKHDEDMPHSQYHDGVTLHPIEGPGRGADRTRPRATLLGWVLLAVVPWVAIAIILYW